LGAGVQIQPNHSGGCEYAAQLRAFDAAGNLLVSFSRGGCSSAAADGSALFLGVRDATATIKRIELVPLPVPQFAGFAINRLSLVLPPVVLVHGICGQPDSFGKMSNLLAKAGLSVTTFDYSSFSNGLPTDVRIEELAGFFADHVNDVRTRTGASQVDVVAHSMGGLIARAWMAGLATVHVPYLGQIRKLVLAGTPNYGINGTLALVRRLAPLGIGCSSTQNDQITHGGIHTESKPETSCS
jgi:pimeloyl-ACP methyl ester carboxylesterase